MPFLIDNTGWRAVPDDFKEADLKAGEKLVAEISEEVLYQLERAKIPARIADRRYKAETAGITVDGTFIDTGRDSQALITGAAVSAMMDDTYVCNWKTPDGFVQLDAPTLKAICKAVRDHVQACFDREAALLALLEKGNFVDDMLKGGWPA
jgi:hypothetical protein